MRFYTLGEAADILRVNPSTLSRQCAAGLFPHVRVGRVVRIPVAELERLEAGEPARDSMLDVPDYGTGTPSMFDRIPEDVDEDIDRDDAGLVYCTGPCCDETTTPSMDDIPEADSPEDDADMGRRGLTSCPDGGCESCPDGEGDER